MGLNDTIVLVLIFIAVLGLLWYLNKKGAISNEGEMYVPSAMEHLSSDAVTEKSSTPALSNSLRNTSDSVPKLEDSKWDDQLTASLTGSKTDFVPKLDNSTNNLSGYNALETTNLAGVTNDEVDKIVNERAQKQLEFNNTDLLPQEINKDWFESDFSNARIKIGNDNLINTDRYMVGINTVGQSLKNPSYDLRPSPPCPKVTISPWNQSTIEPDFNIKPWY
jgi:hypothetical protein